MRRELGSLVISGKTLGVRSFYKILYVFFSISSRTLTTFKKRTYLLSNIRHAELLYIFRSHYFLHCSLSWDKPRLTFFSTVWGAVGQGALNRDTGIISPLSPWGEGGGGGWGLETQHSIYSSLLQLGTVSLITENLMLVVALYLAVGWGGWRGYMEWRRLSLTQYRSLLHCLSLSSSSVASPSQVF